MGESGNFVEKKPAEFDFAPNLVYIVCGGEIDGVGACGRLPVFRSPLSRDLEKARGPRCGDTTAAEPVIFIAKTRVVQLNKQ